MSEAIWRKQWITRRQNDRIGGMMKLLLKCVSFVFLSFPGLTQADDSKAFRIEGHVFSATTLKPLPGVAVELHAFYQPGEPAGLGYAHVSDEGGFYRFEITPKILNDEGNDAATGYAFAFVCRHGSNNKVQVQPLYSSLTPKQVYHRNVYMQVPESVKSCDSSF